ncbi:polyprenyl synthetase family protein [Benzoatithermus flavus]|uniref:Polyprenyl synthetase family protein n=1 Tax=Benzoatithermus flavus TaxID=3108223 RepID=A0ABU8XTS9_9PROT
MSTVLLEARMATVAAAVEVELAALLPAAEGAQARLNEAMRYAALGGGKRLRPFLVAATAELFGITGAAPIRVGAAVELIHAYSLVHDDLPAMDDAALRRGRPSCHRAFDEATAILAGDALQALAFEVLARDDYGADPGQRCRLVRKLAEASGALGMCGGQMIDLLAERQELTVAEITTLQRLKTGAIIGFSCEAGAVLGRAGSAETEALRGYAHDLGLAFQIKDDLLDLEGDSAVTGKDSGRDSEVGKATFVRRLGVAGARAKLEELRRSALGRLDIFGDSARVLGQLFAFVIDRRS